MLISQDDAALFYRAWSALLTWVNDQRGNVPRFARPTPEHPIDPSLANKIKDVVWAEDALREQFLAEGSADLGPEERDLVASWTHRVSGSFVIFKHLQKHLMGVNCFESCIASSSSTAPSWFSRSNAGTEHLGIHISSERRSRDARIRPL